MSLLSQCQRRHLPGVQPPFGRPHRYIERHLSEVADSHLPAELCLSSGQFVLVVMALAQRICAYAMPSPDDIKTVT